MNYFVHMLLNFPHQAMNPTRVSHKRCTEKAREAHKAKTRQWFLDNMQDSELTTSQIASKRGQTNSSCLPLLYALEQEGFIQRVGRGPRTGRGQCPVIWKLTQH